MTHAEPRLISDHVFRLGHISASTTGTGSAGGQAVVPGMCAYNGNCNRPAAEHERSRRPRLVKQ